MHKSRRELSIEVVIHRGIFNLLTPSDAVRKQKKNISDSLFSPVLKKFKKYHPLETLNFII